MGIGPGSGLRQTIGRRGDLADDSATGTLMSLLRNIDDEVENVERGIYNYERWRGMAAPQVGENWAADSLNPFLAVSGNDAYGTDPGDAAQVIGQADVPILASQVSYDVHSILITAQTSVTPWKLRLIFGSGTMNAAIAANQFAEVCHVPVVGAGAFAGGGVVIAIMPRIVSGTDRLWVQAWNATDNAIVSFLVGIREHDE